MTTELTDDALPVLPTPAATGLGDEYESFDCDGRSMGKAYENIQYFTADQMRAYAAQAVEEDRAARGVPDGWREFVERVAKQKPEKPDYWSACGQCERNESDAEDLLAAAPQPAAHPERKPMTIGKAAGLCSRLPASQQHPCRSQAGARRRRLPRDQGRAMTYRIETIADLLAIPADRRAACFRQIEYALSLHELAFTCGAPFVIDWTDDGNNYVTFCDQDGEEFMSLEITKEAP